MKKSLTRVTLPVFLFVVFFSFTGKSAEAYTLQSHDEIRIGNSVLFLLNFGFGHEKHTIEIPALADSDDTHTRNALSYRVVNEDNDVAIGTAHGIVLSATGIGKDGMYSSEKNEGVLYTLAVLFTPEEIKTTDESYRVMVTHLPFTFDRTIQLQLNPSELTYYVSDFISL